MNQTVMDWPDHLTAQAFMGLGKLENASNQGAKAADIVRRYALLERLAAFDPVIVGTLPLAIDTPSSDIDILCEVSDFDAFQDVATKAFGTLEGFGIHARQATPHVPEALVMRFDLDGLPIEIFATNRPSIEQYGFIHMLVEARIIALLGDGFADQVRRLKGAGVKTEPAFAQILGLEGDPYIALAEMAALSPDQMREELGLSE
ncbi:MAG: DUF4269 domain-containing protein [Porticoccaceae bacterium]|uniref:DUF4269 domain-containing protein n=1 Tax=Thalassospira sp. TaxID=1912094 RepID=UPI003A85C530